MGITDSIINYRRFLKRRNYSTHTVNNYMNHLRHFVLWLDIPIEQVNHKKILEYVEGLLNRGLCPKTINCHLSSIRGFYDYLYYEQEIKVTNPVKKRYTLRLPKPLPRHLKEEQIDVLFDAIKSRRDWAMFRVMLRCGLRVEEVAKLTLGAIDLKRRRIYVQNGKGGKDRVVYISNDACDGLLDYFKVRPKTRSNRVFLAQKAPYRGKPISVRGIQKRIEYYGRKAKLEVSCHRLRHTMATQMLNAGSDIVSIQELLGHNWVSTTQRYSNVSNLKVQRDYFKAMEVLIQGSARDPCARRE
jgi:site-specific recombinase XerD